MLDLLTFKFFMENRLITVGFYLPTKEIKQTVLK